MSQPLITGSFLDIQHVNNWDAQYWIDACRDWQAENWAALIDDMAAAGMDTAFVLGCALWGRPLYPANRKTVGIPLPLGCADPLAAIVGAAERHGMSVLLGLGFFGRCTLSANPDISKEHDTWLVNMAVDLQERYGHSPSFKGFYLSNEMQSQGGLFLPDDVTRNARFVRMLRERVGRVKLMTSPSNLKEPRPEQLDVLTRQLEELDIDIVSYQDHAGFGWDYEAAARGFALVRPIHHKLGQQMWVNCEVFDFERRPDGRGVCIPCQFERLEKQLRSAAPVADKIICYQYQGIMNRKSELVQIGAPGTEALYNHYMAFRRKILQTS